MSHSPVSPAFFAEAALGKGELLGLKQTDVRRERRQIVVARSYDHGTTKSKKERIIPIADALVQYLEAAIDASPSEYVFPAPDGEMMPENTKVEVILRRALGRAGVVTGYRHSCRRCKAAGVADSPQLATDATPRKCSRCGMQMWCKPIPRHLRFHDLRHTTATLILAHGGTLWEVQKILGHSDPNITAKVYAHLVPGFLETAVNRLPIGKRATPNTAPGVRRSVLVSPWSATRSKPQKAKARPRENLLREPGLWFGCGGRI
jgi:integrase